MELESVDEKLVGCETEQIVESPMQKFTPVKFSLKSPLRDMLTCPFCCNEYLFDFMMKDHIERHHKEELRRMDNWPVEQFYCQFCSAMFYYSALIPKHIYFAHGKEKLDEHFDTSNNFQKFQIDKENMNEPSINFLNCSPGLSELFNDLDTCDSVKKFRLGNDSVFSTPMSRPRSILKKTPYSGKIVILSPETVALRRTINSVKRTASARRELRFDLPPLQKSPPVAQDEVALPPCETSPKKTKFWKLFKRSPKSMNAKIKKKIRIKACKLSNQSANNIITSTPMGLLDDTFDSSIELDRSIDTNWKSAMKTSSFRPLFFTSERFQCNLCEAKFDSNAELLYHHKTGHRRISLLPPFRCGQCSATFYRNCYLVRHCQYQHTPSRK